jgi:tRNA dimethylallyltransferase
MFVIIAGATATGKSGAAVALAKIIGGEVISADSMQVYRGMDIGTFKISAAEMRGIKHHLIDILSPHEAFSAACFKELAEKSMDSIIASGKKAVIAGGTGLYINSIIRGLAPGRETPPEIKESLRRELASRGLAHMVGMLEALDPDASRAIDIKNGRRVIRAIEQIKSSGKTLEEFRKSALDTVYNDDHKMFILQLPRMALYERLDKRVDEMLQRGLVGEVKNLLDSGFLPGETAMQAIGYKEIALYINGLASYKDAVEMIKSATRNYAKRQETWFKKYPEAVRIDIQGLSPEEIAGVIAGGL